MRFSGKWLGVFSLVVGSATTFSACAGKEDSMRIDDTQQSMLSAALRQEFYLCKPETAFTLSCDAENCLIKFADGAQFEKPIRHFSLEYTLDDMLRAGNVIGFAMTKLISRTVNYRVNQRVDGKSWEPNGITVKGMTGPIGFDKLPLRYLAFEASCAADGWTVGKLAGPDAQKAIDDPDLFARRVLLSAMETARLRLKK